MRIGEEVLTSSGQLPSDDSPASRTRSRVRADYMAATRATETTTYRTCESKSYSYDISMPAIA